MFCRLLIVCAALAAAPSAFAQHLQPPAQPLEPVYVSAGLAWSNELGVELEAGFQAEPIDGLLLRFSPVNLSLFDGDVADGYHWSGPNAGADCREDGSNIEVIDAYCELETDSEWRSVVEAQFRIAPGFHFGGGVSYLLQGDFKPEDGRVAPFLSMAWDAEDGMGFEIRAGSEYVALQLRGLW